MYVPTNFAETDQHKLHNFIERNSFGTLVSNDLGGLVASHLPLLLEREHGQHGQLVGHMARANSQWKELDAQSVLTIFAGPHAYISPTWLDDAHVVPTWNYISVHVYGKFLLDDDRSRRLEIVQRYVETYEAEMAQSWSLESADGVFVDGLLDAIVGFRIDIDRIEGKWKLNQNHEMARRANIIRALRGAGGADREQIADLMSETLTD